MFNTLLLNTRFIYIVLLIASHLIVFTYAYYSGMETTQNKHYEALINQNARMLNEYRGALEIYNNLADNYAAESRLNLAARTEAERSVMAYVENLNNTSNHRCLDRNVIGMLNNIIAGNPTPASKTQPRSQRHDPMPTATTHH